MLGGKFITRSLSRRFLYHAAGLEVPLRPAPPGGWEFHPTGRAVKKPENFLQPLRTEHGAGGLASPTANPNVKGPNDQQEPAEDRVKLT